MRPTAGNASFACRHEWRCEVTAQVWQAIWEKLAFNAALDTLTAVTRLPLGGVGAATLRSTTMDS